MKNAKRILSVVLCLLMSISMLTAIVLPAAAEDTLIENIALNKPVSCNLGDWSSSYAAAYAVDGNTGTRWNAADHSLNLQTIFEIDLQGLYRLKDFKIIRHNTVLTECYWMYYENGEWKKGPTVTELGPTEYNGSFDEGIVAEKLRVSAKSTHSVSFFEVIVSGYAVDVSYDTLLTTKATNVTVSGSSAGKSLSNTDILVDGSNATNNSWTSVNDATDVYVTFDLGKSMGISEVVLTTRVNGWAQWFNAYKFYVTDEAPVYGEEAKPTGLPETATLEGTSEWLGLTQDVYYAFPKGTEGRYITLYMDKLIGGYYVRNEIKYNVDDDPATPEDNLDPKISIGDFRVNVINKASEIFDFSDKNLPANVRDANNNVMTNATAKTDNGVTWELDRLNNPNVNNNGATAFGVYDFYLTFDFGSVETINKLYLRPRQHGGCFPRFIKDFELYASDTQPTYSGRGELVDDKGSATTDDDVYAPGPVPTGIGDKVHEGSFAKPTNVNDVYDYKLENAITCRYLTLHVKNVHIDPGPTAEFDVGLIQFYGLTATPAFTSLEVDYENDKLVIPESDSYTATIATSSNTNVVALNGTVNTYDGGASNVVLKLEFADGMVCFTTPITVVVWGQKAIAIIGEQKILSVTVKDADSNIMTNATAKTDYGVTWDLDRLVDPDVGKNGATAFGVYDFYLTFDFGSVETINKLYLRPRQHGACLTRFIKDFELYASDTQPTYNGRGELVDDKGSATTDDDVYAPGPVPTGIGDKVHEGSFAKPANTYTVYDYELENAITCRYLTLHVKNVHIDPGPTAEFDVGLIQFYGGVTATTSFTSLEVDYDTGKLVIPEGDFSATIAYSSNPDVVALDFSADTLSGGTSDVVLKIELNDGTVGFTAPFTVNVEPHVGDTVASIGATRYDSLDAALKEVKADETIVLRNDAETDLLVLDGFKVDLNGKSLTADHVIGFKGSAVIDSKDNGKLVVAKDNVVLDTTNDGFLPVYNEAGKCYQFSNISIIHKQLTATANEGENTYHYVFLPVFESFVHEDLALGADKSAVKVVLRLNWIKADNYVATQDFTYIDEFVSDVITSYDATANNYEYAFSADLKRAEASVEDNAYTITAVLVSDTGVEIASDSLPLTANINA